jgi:hypothetical protein
MPPIFAMASERTILTSLAQRTLARLRDRDYTLCKLVFDWGPGIRSESGRKSC